MSGVMAGPPNELADVAELARDLRAASAAIDAHVEARAQEIAAQRIAAVVAVYEGREAAIEQAWAGQKERWDSLEAEFRRQIDSLRSFQEKHVRGRCVPAVTGDRSG